MSEKKAMALLAIFLTFSS